MAQRSEVESEQTAAASQTQRPGSEAAARASANAIIEGTAAGPHGAHGAHGARGVEHYVGQLVDPSAAAAQEAAQVLTALLQLKPELLTPQIETLIRLLSSPHSSAAHCAAHCLPVLARVTPAKVAKHLKTMQSTLPDAPEVAKDGLVRTFVALCVASVTYQKRLIDSFELALRTASPTQLPSWVEHILPALKGEPYAQARSVVEQRLPDPTLPREVAQRIADFLGVKLRPLPERR